MPRKPVVRSDQHYYHVTARSNNREFFYLPIEDVWGITCLKLGELQKKYDLKIAAYVLMSNHFHLLVKTPNEDIDKVMYFFMKEVTISIQRRSGRINKIFGGRYKGCIITNANYLMNVYKYILRNPLEVGLAQRAEDYIFSSLYYTHLPGLRLPFNIEVVLSKTYFEQYLDIDELGWINNSYKAEEAESIKHGLHRTIFAYKKDRNTNRDITPQIVHKTPKSSDELWAELVENNIVESYNDENEAS